MIALSTQVSGEPGPGHQDGRYSIPSVVFVAALAAGAVATARRPLRIAGQTLLVALLLVNTLAINTPLLGLEQIPLPGIENRLVLLDERGYTGSRPQRSPRTYDLLQAARREGVQAFAADFSPQTTGKLQPSGLALFGRLTGLPLVAGDAPVMREGHGIFLARSPIPPAARGHASTSTTARGCTSSVASRPIYSPPAGAVSLVRPATLLTTIGRPAAAPNP